VLTGLPILSFLQFLGGIDPNLVLAGYAVTGLTMLGLAGLSILASAYCKRSRDAIAICYLIVFAYYAVSFTVYGFQFFWPPHMPYDWGHFFADLFAGSLDWDRLFWDLIHKAANAFNAGNLLLQLTRNMGPSGRISDTLLNMLGDYAIFQGVVAVAGTVLAIWQLRPVALRQMSSSKVRRRNVLGIRFRRPPVGDLPMVWKELHIEGGMRLHWVVWLVVLALMAVTFLPAYFIIDPLFTGHRGPDIATGMNVWARTMTALVGCLTLLAVAARAATSISGERDRQTLDGLLTTPMTATQILAAKVLGNITSIRLAWIWLGLIWLLALATGGLHPFAIPFVMAAWLVYAFTLSMLGCWFSVVSRTSTRAIVYTLLSTVGLAVGHWLPWFCCIPLMMFGPGRGGGGEAFMHLGMFQVGITPPAALGFLTFYARDFGPGYGMPSTPGFIGYSFCGLFVWLVGGIALCSLTLDRFRRLTQRGRESLVVLHDQGGRPAPWPPSSRQGPEMALPPRPAPFPATPPPMQPRGAILIEEVQEPPKLMDVILIEEIQEQPPRPPLHGKDGN
jgi:hypothetical protein